MFRKDVITYHIPDLEQSIKIIVSPKASEIRSPFKVMRIFREMGLIRNKT